MHHEQEYLEERAAQWRISRRRLLALGAAAVPALATAGRLTWPAPAVADGPIVKPLPPEWFIDHGTNAEMRWESLRDVGHRVPNARFFVRNHTATPAIDAATWRLRVSGTGLRGARAVEFSLRDLLRMPARHTTAAIECAGNGRSFFGSQQGTPASGTPWKLGAIGVAEWKGVPLGELLERAGLRRGPSTSCRRGSTRRSSAAASTRATCDGRCRSARRSTTCCSRTR